MGEMASLWGYAEHRDMDQLGQKLLYTTLELEKLRSEAEDEMRKSKEYVKQLIELLKCAIEERDEARKQLEKLITINSPTEPDFFPATIIPHDSSPLLKPPNSSITESNSLSETHNHHSDAVSSANHSFTALDRGSLIIENLAKGRVLPQKGMLLHSVLQAGPLLQTLMVAGPLPRWRNPPQMQPFQIPPVAIKGGDDACQLGSRQHYMSDFGNVNLSGTTCLNNASSFISSAVSSNSCFRLPKRQRFC